MASTITRSTILLGSLCLGAALISVGCGGGSEEPEAPAGTPTNNAAKTPPAPSGSTAALGKTLFETNCAVCHGSGGEGDGVGAAALTVKPRNLTTEPYKFVPIATSANEADALVAYLKVGRVESGMPPFAHLSDADLHSLALFVESLRPKPDFVDPVEEKPAADKPAGEG